MAVSCKFALNGKPLSTLDCGEDGKYEAFSGLGERANDPTATAIEFVGPLPKGTYYILDRQSGGHIGFLRDWFKRQFSTDRGRWFSLFRKDEDIDDYTVVDGVTRGNFRLHARGGEGISEGCVTMQNPADFDMLYDKIKHSQMISIPGTPLFAYGTIEVE